MQAGRNFEQQVQNEQQAQERMAGSFLKVLNI
jgi:hypothetical protein